MRHALLAAVVLTIVGCAPFQQLPSDFDFGAPPEGYEQTAKSYFYRVLKDPQSAMYEFSPPYPAYENLGLAQGGGIGWAGYVVDVRINAKNSYGGYAGWQTFRLYFDQNRARGHCKLRQNLDESVFETCNDMLFHRAPQKGSTRSLPIEGALEI